MKANIGLIGLAVMGENLVLNMESKGFTVAVYNRTTSKVEEFISGRAKNKNIIGCTSVTALVASLESPKKIMLMVQAGTAVDAVLQQLVPLLTPGDIIIDGGNSHYPDTQRRVEELSHKGILFIGTGVSGGEEGALTGPSIMPGGNSKAWPYIKPIFQKISAQVANEPCSEWMGEGGAGHYVKMVHNGIEYGDMQLIAESYSLLKYLGKTNDELYAIFDDWNASELSSYLIEITRDILGKKDDEGVYVIDTILDAAGQKGTGKWTAIESLNHGIPLTLITESVYARALSAIKDERVIASKQIQKTCIDAIDISPEDIKRALYASKIISYAQGFALLKQASLEFNWGLNFPDIAKIWRGGCIIRSAFLNDITHAFTKNSELQNLMLDPFFKDILEQSQTSLRKVVAFAVSNAIPVPTLSSAIAYFDGYTSAQLPANIIQAQRDFFGAHTYERIDKPRGTFFHTNWTGRGGKTTSNQYNV